MTHIITTPRKLLIGALALLIHGGCGGSGGPSEPEASEDPGVLLVSPPDAITVAAHHLVWTRDGSELLYITSNGVTGVSASTRAVRQVAAFASIVSVARAKGGERIYFTAFAADAAGSTANFRISRLHPASGIVEHLMQVVPDGESSLVLSDDERFLVTARTLHDLQTGGRITLPAGKPFGFSADGTQLLYGKNLAGSSHGEMTLISTADGSSRTLHSTGDFHISHRWEGNSPQLLKETKDFVNNTVSLSEIDGLTGASRELAQFSARPTSLYADWSPDGRTLAAWMQQGSMNNLYVIRPGSGPTLVAKVNRDYGKPQFSPSGSSVAYFIFSANDVKSLYMKSGI